MSTASTIDTTGLDRTIKYLSSFERLDPRPMLDDWTKILIEGNRVGVLSGLNAAGEVASPPLKYRGGAGSPTKARPKGPSFGEQLKGARTGGFFGQQKASHEAGGFGGKVELGQLFNIRRGHFTGPGKTAQVGLPNNNLTTAQYRKLTGPFAAPRREYSRIITNFKVQIPQQTSDHWTWLIKAGWVDVVDVKGDEFYSRLFGTSSGRQYAGVRPVDRQHCRDVMIEWFRHWLTQAKAGQI